MNNLEKQIENDERRPPLKCPICGNEIAWYSEYISAYICSSDWDGCDEKGTPKPCRNCEN